MMKFQLMSVNHLIKFLNKFGLDKIIREAGEDLNKLSDCFPTVPKLGKVLIDKE